MQSAAEIVELGRKARNAGNIADALKFYNAAVEAFESEGDPVKAEHSRRHSADLQLELGQIDEARESIGKVIAYYRANGTGTLEMGNTLRIAALVEAAAGDTETARGFWVETLARYEEVGVQAGIDEVRRRLA